MFGPLLIFVLSSLLLITSLLLHIKHMRCKEKVTSFLDAYYRIIKYTTGSLCTSVLCVIISVLAEKCYDMLGFVLVSVPLTTFRTSHSILLIYATPKLKNPISRLLKYLSKCLIKREKPRDIVRTITTWFVDGVSSFAIHILVQLVQYTSSQSFCSKDVQLSRKWPICVSQSSCHFPFPQRHTFNSIGPMQNL